MLPPSTRSTRPTANPRQSHLKPALHPWKKWSNGSGRYPSSSLGLLASLITVLSAMPTPAGIASGLPTNGPWSATIYVSKESQRTRLGRGLYTSLFRVLALQGYFKVFAGITLPNAASVGLHEAVGFKPVGIYRGVGYKLGSWHDVGWWQLTLQSESDDPAAPRSIQEIRNSQAVQEALVAGELLVKSGS